MSQFGLLGGYVNIVEAKHLVYLLDQLGQGFGVIRVMPG
jgi:hypothetical protein